MYNYFQVILRSFASFDDKLVRDYGMIVKLFYYIYAVVSSTTIIHHKPVHVSCAAIKRDTHHQKPDNQH